MLARKSRTTPKSGGGSGPGGSLCSLTAAPSGYNSEPGMDLGTSRIPAHSRRQAMDWSLVLLSQGIEATIDYSEEGAGWGLLVEAADYDKAVAAIWQYRVENRGWPWQQRVFE